MNLKYFSIILFFLFCLNGGLYSIDKKKNTSAYRVHVVKKGETVYSIASIYNLTVDELYELNPDTSKGLKENENLKIPLNAKINNISHTISPKETLYSVAKQYNVSVEDILSLNKGLGFDNFQVGRIIEIPRFSSSADMQSKPSSKVIEHRVMAKETLYSISKQYNVTVDDIIAQNPDVKNGLKEDVLLSISQGGSTFINKSNTIKETSVMKIGLLLPFLDKQESQRARFIEYYEGFLLAVEDIKAKGHSVEIYAFDIGNGSNTKKLESLLGTAEMKDLDLIIGGVYNEQIGLLKDFSKKTGVKYVIPFPVKGGNMNVATGAFLVNAPHDYVYAKAALIFARRFKDYNVVIVSDDSSVQEKKDFITIFKSKMTEIGVSEKTVEASNNLSVNLQSALSTTKPNIIIPTSSSQKTLAKLLTALRSAVNQKDEFKISLFGYPDWQTYSSQFLSDFFKYDTYIYTPFYLETNKSEVKDFMDRYKKWYGKIPMNTYPRYAVFGYDTGLYFMSAIAQNGTEFGNKVFTISAPTIQSAFSFSEIPSVGGYVNVGLYFVHYNTDSTIEKIDCSR